MIGSDGWGGARSAMIARYGRSDDRTGWVQVLTTLVPFALLWWVAIELAARSLWLIVLPLPLLVLLLVRVFGLMHECGHGSLFRSCSLNRSCGFLLGVIAGMPQYVWSQHHNYHHAHNGDWDKYRGPYATLTVEEYTALSRARQRAYRCKCSVFAAPLAGFIYLIFNPRYNWIRGTMGLGVHLVRQKLAQPRVPLRALAATYQTRLWASRREYRHMLWNNVVLLGAGALLCLTCGTAAFLLIYVLSVSLAGGVGIILFTVQHNFSHSYASDSQHWNPDTAVLEGTSFLVLPRWLNWFTVNIGYHHIHHLSSSIPSYRLAACHEEYAQLFTRVRRIGLGELLGALRCILWDRAGGRIIALAELPVADVTHAPARVG